MRKSDSNPDPLPLLERFQAKLVARDRLAGQSKTWLAKSWPAKSWRKTVAERLACLTNARAYGLRKHGVTERAEHGADGFQIMSFLAHKSTREALTCIRATSRKRMVEPEMAPVDAADLSNLSDRLCEISHQFTERKWK